MDAGPRFVAERVAVEQRAPARPGALELTRVSNTIDHCKQPSVRSPRQRCADDVPTALQLLPAIQAEQPEALPAALHRLVHQAPAATCAALMSQPALADIPAAPVVSAALSLFQAPTSDSACNAEQAAARAAVVEYLQWLVDEGSTDEHVHSLLASALAVADAEEPLLRCAALPSPPVWPLSLLCVTTKIGQFHQHGW